VKTLAAALLFAGCIEAPMPMDEMPCPPTGTAHTYANFGAGFVDTYCNGCHTTSKNGAPSAFKFDTIEDIRRHADRIFVRSAGPNTTMPVGPVDPPADQREQLAEWLACGAP
jgi:uncharacterized membrane protein